MAAAAAAAPETCAARPPSLHVLRLHESPIRNEDDYERFSWQWILKNNNNQDTTTIQPGDLLCFPELFSGAGEFEGLRFVGAPNDDDQADDELPLWSAGIEAPVFPARILEMQPEGTTLRNNYEGHFNTVLSEYHGGMSLEDLFGGEDVVEEFWQSPDLARRKKASEEKWYIPLEQCTIEKSFN